MTKNQIKELFHQQKVWGCYSGSDKKWYIYPIMEIPMPQKDIVSLKSILDKSKVDYEFINEQFKRK